MNALSESAPDPRTMDPRELLRGLMRGNRAELKQGYSAPNAVAAVTSIHGESEELDLLAYAMGFAAGMAESNEKSYPAESPSPVEQPEPVDDDATEEARDLLDRIGESLRKKFQPGVRVRAKSGSWGTGRIESVNLSDPEKKPLTVRNDDGGPDGYFRMDQVEVITEGIQQRVARELGADPTLTAEFHRAVVDQLNGMGLRATYEYPGMVTIDRDDGTTVNTGQHGWDYGAIQNADGSPQDETDEVTISHEEGTYPTPRAVAAAWYEAIEGVIPVPGITPAQLRAVAKSVETMNRGGIGAGPGDNPIACLGVDVKPIREAEIDGKDGDVLAVFKYQPVVGSGSSIIGREETCFARNGDVRWSQDYG